MNNNQDNSNQDNSNKEIKRLILEHLEQTTIGKKTVFVPIEKTCSSAWDFLTALEQVIPENNE